MDKNFATNSVDNNPSLNCNFNQINNNLFAINATNNGLNNSNNNNNINAMKNINNFNVNKSHTIRDICESNHKTQQIQKKSAISSQSNQKSPKISGHNCHQRHTSNQQMSATYFNNCNNNPSMDPLLDRTPCGSATLTPHFDESYDTPPYIRWQQDFHYLLDDKEGIQLFQKYLESEGLEQLLNFWAACEGLRTNELDDKEMIRKLINIIYKRFIRNPKTIQVSDKVRAALKQGLTTDSCADPNYDPKYDRHVFDSAQNEVEEQLKSSIYVNFLRSDVYLDYLQSSAFPNSSLGAVGGSYDKSSLKDSATSTTHSSMSTSLESNFDDYNLRSTQNNQYYDVVLPTVDEESELQTDSSLNRSTTIDSGVRSQTQNKFQSISINACHNLMSSGSNDIIMSRLNKIVSQRSADNSSARLTTELYPSSPNHNRGTMSYPSYQSYLRSKQSSHPPNPYHVTYSTVHNPSARDSELQSLSSQSTNDSMSCVSGQDGTDNTALRIKKQHNIAIKNNAKLNSSANYMNANTLTYPLRAHKQQTPIEASNPERFAHMLIEKLEKVKKERESHESNDKKLAEVLQLVYIEPNSNKSNPSARQPSANPSDANVCRLKEILKERVAEQKFEFCPPEDNDQEILDKHCEQVFRTPNETPTDSINRCVSPPKQHSFRAYEQRMTPPVSAQMTGFDATPQIGVTVKYSTEQIPYRLTMTGPHITLRRFRQQIQASLPAKRGNWQYYFKRKCDDRELIDISAAYVLEKITDDNVLLPLIDGKIFAELQESN